MARYLQLQGTSQAIIGTFVASCKSRAKRPPAKPLVFLLARFLLRVRSNSNAKNWNLLHAFPIQKGPRMTTNTSPDVDPSDETCSDAPEASEARPGEQVKRDHTDGLGNKIPAERIVYAETLFVGVGTDANAPLTPRAIQRALCAKYGVQPRQARRYMQIARQNLTRAAKHMGASPEALVARADARFNETYTLARANGDAAAMVQSTQRQAELHGLVKREVKVDAKLTGLADALASVFSKVGD